MIPHPLKSYGSGAAITPHDTNAVSPVTEAIYVGGAGDLKVDLPDGSALTFKAVPVGTLLPIRASKVYSTGTTATLLIALW